MRLTERIFPLTAYRSTIARERAVLVYAINILLVAGVLVFGVSTRALGGSTILQRYAGGAIALWVLALGLSAALSIALTRIGRMRAGALVVVVMTAIILNFPAIQTGYYNTGQVLLVAFVVLMAALLLGNFGLIVGGVLATSFLVLGYAVRVTLPPPDTSNNLNAFSNSMVMIALIIAIAYLFLRYARLSRAEGVMVTQEDRFRLAQITSQVTQGIARRSDLSDVLNVAVDLVRDSYPDVYHVQIFLIEDTGEQARLAASTGEVGRLLLQRRHGLAVGSQSVIGQVTASGKPVVARAGEKTIHKRNEFLPDTAAEAAFPLRLGDTIIGALDLQSKLGDVFREEDLPVFQSLADHIAIAIDNARLFEQTAERMHDNQQLMEQTRLAAQEVERLNRRLTGRSWDEYLQQGAQSQGVGLNLADMTTTPQQEWTPALQQAMRFNHLVQEMESRGGQVIAVPLRVRGQVIGAMEFELDGTGNLSPEDVTLLEEVGEQLGMAAETNRLFESSQRLAQREALVNEIATRLQTSTSVEMTLNVAARSLKEALKAERVSIRLGPRPSEGDAAAHVGDEGAR
jgi:GAF domain-containing protein